MSLFSSLSLLNHIKTDSTLETCKAFKQSRAAYCFAVRLLNAEVIMML